MLESYGHRDRLLLPPRFFCFRAQNRELGRFWRGDFPINWYLVTECVSGYERAVVAALGS